MTEDYSDCALCGLPTNGHPLFLNTKDKVLAFCCEGCRDIYELLHPDELRAPLDKKPSA